MKIDHKNPRKTILPVYKIKTIMKTTPDVSQVSNDAYFMMALATEMFISYFTEESYKKGDGRGYLEYKDLANEVQRDETLDFLRDLIPKKITMRQYREIMEEKSRTANEEDLSFYLNGSLNKKDKK